MNIWGLPYCEYSYIVIFGWTNIWSLPYCDYVHTFHGWVTWGAIITSYFLYDIVETMLCVHPLFPFPGKAGDDISHPPLWFSWDHVTKFRTMEMQAEVIQPWSAPGSPRPSPLPDPPLPEAGAKGTEMVALQDGGGLGSWVPTWRRAANQFQPVTWMRYKPLCVKPLRF